MTRRILIAVWAVVAALAAAGVIWFYVAGNVGDPTVVTAPPITSTVSDPAPEPSVAPTTAAVTTSAATVAEDSPGAQSEETAPPPSEDPDDTSTAETPTTTEAIPESTVELQLSEGTEARFLIFEELRGEPFTVVGATTEVVGRIRVDRSDLSASQVGEILINARTFATESSNRDRAIRGPILGAEQHEFILFRPTSLRGLGGAAEPGGEWSFEMEGDLAVRDIVRPVVFSVVARWGPGDVLEGEAAATVLRSDFDLSVPSVPFVANVADEVGLELKFVAETAG